MATTTAARRNYLIPVLFIVALLLIGRLFFGGPFPHIQIAAEPLFTVGGFTVTNTLVASWITILVLVLLSVAATSRMQMIPTGLQNLLEAMVEAILGLVEQVAGHRNGRRFFPLIATIFLFVLFNNWTGLLPGYGTVGIARTEEHGVVFDQLGPIRYVGLGAKTVEKPESGKAPEITHSGDAVAGELVPFLRSASTDLNVPLAIALMSFVFVEYWGLSTLRAPYLAKFFNFRSLLRGNLMMGLIDVFVGLLELLSEFARIISFTFRLFGNIFAGEVVLVAFTFLTPWVLVTLFLGVELFVGLVQALIFAMLTLIFATLAVTGHGGEEHSSSSSH